MAALQETKLSLKAKSPIFPGYTLLREDRPRGGGGGVALLIHHSLSFSRIDTSFLRDKFIECIAIRVEINGADLDLFNVYIPPASSCTAHHSPDIGPILHLSDNDVIVCGDFNVHHGGWHSTLVDIRGETLANTIENSPLIVLNEDTPTRLPTNGNPTSPDISLASAHLALASHWSTLVGLNSDHLPILVALPTSQTLPPPGQQRHSPILGKQIGQDL